MIVSMQKVTVLGSVVWQEELLATIGDLGVVHIIPLTPEEEENDQASLQDVKEKINLLEEAISLMPASAASDLEINSLACAEQLLALNEQQRRLTEEIKELEKEYEGLRIWGGFSREQLEILKKKGLALRFFLAVPKDLHKIPFGTDIFLIGRQGQRLLLAALACDENLHVLEEIPLPPKDIMEIETLLADRKRAKAEGALKMKTLLQYRTALVRDLCQQKERLSFTVAQRAMATTSDISYLKGFCPSSRLHDLREVTRRQGLGLIVEEPSKSDPVPTLLQYSRWAILFKPVLDLLGIIPGYREFDCNGLSLVFFIIFVAILIGDAGYGLFFFLTGLFFFYQGRLPRESVFLLIILAAATMFWGALTGNWFGDAGFKQIPLLENMVFPELSASTQETAGSVMQFCFFLGAVQLIVAHLWLAIRKIPSFSAVAEIGWILLLWAIYYITLFLIINKPLPPLIYNLFGSGVVLILVFSEQSDTFSFKAIGKALAHSPLTLLSGINSLSDLISYIRLFAVGLAGREVALAVNQLALDVGFDSVFSILTSFAILIAGHSLNIILGIMAILVHGLRLNLLEFSRHLEVTWSGIPYTPLGKDNT